jgi:hypothetical protein
VKDDKKKPPKKKRKKKKERKKRKTSCFSLSLSLSVFSVNLQNVRHQTGGLV